MRWATAISDARNVGRALEETCEVLNASLGGQSPHLLLIFVSPHHGEDTMEISEHLQEAFPDAVLVGCSGGGIIGAYTELEDSPALSITAAHLPDVGIVPFHVDAADLDDLSSNPDRWHDLLNLEPDQQPCFVLLPDPFSCPTEQLTTSLDEAFPGCAKVGGMASGAKQPGDHVLFVHDVCLFEGAVGLALWGDICMDTVVAQGCRPVGEPLRISRCEENVLLELDGSPALVALDQVFEGLNERDQALFSQSPHIGVAMDTDQSNPGWGDFLVRNIIGIDREHKVVAVGGMLEEGQRVQFHIRDAGSSAEDIRRLLSRYAEVRRATPPAGALLFSCLGRGQRFYGIANHDSGVFRSALGDLALGGFFCNGEIGPVHGKTHLHGYTSSFAVFRSRGWD
jgi:small ligand-binding sensory domain FIST